MHTHTAFLGPLAAAWSPEASENGRRRATPCVFARPLLIFPKLKAEIVLYAGKIVSLLDANTARGWFFVDDSDRLRSLLAQVAW